MDIERAETFEDALHGASTVFLMARAEDEHPERTTIPFVSAMKQYRVQ